MMVFGLLPGACSLQPNRRRPDPAIPPAWSGEPNQGLQDTVAVRSGRWRSFGSAELCALEERLTENYGLKAAIARIEDARGTAQIAGAPLYPTLSLNGTLDHSNGEGTDLKTSRTQKLFNLVTYAIDFWGKNGANAEAARSLATASQSDSDTVAMTLVASLADAYFQVLSLQQRIRLAKTIARDAARVPSLIEPRLSVGTAAEVDVAQQRNTVATFNAAVPLLQHSRRSAPHLVGHTGQGAGRVPPAAQRRHRPRRQAGQWTGMGGPNGITRGNDGNFYIAEREDRDKRPMSACAMPAGRCSCDWRADNVQGVGLDARGDLYAGLTVDRSVVRVR
jgi:outer membrane protein TolC